MFNLHVVILGLLSIFTSTTAGLIITSAEPNKTKFCTGLKLEAPCRFPAEGRCYPLKAMDTDPMTYYIDPRYYCTFYTSDTCEGKAKIQESDVVKTVPAGSGIKSIYCTANP